MDYNIDPEVSGEVLIPFENNSFSLNKHPPTFQDLSSCSFKSFRKILFQGETLKFYIVLKAIKKNEINIQDFFDKIFFKIEFEPNDIDKNLNINENESSSDDNNINDKEINYNFYSSNKNKEKLNLEIKKDEFEEIQAKIYDEESCSEIYEIVKEILVPENFIDFNFLMKISIYVENYNIFSKDTNENNILNFYQHGIFNNMNNYRYFKIFFKEIKIINALNILNMTQLDPKIEVSLIKTKLSNNNESYDFFDAALKNSKIFQNMKTEKADEKISNNNKNISIRDIRILKNESCFDEENTYNIDFIKNVLINEKKLLKKDDYEISIFNKNKFPFIIGSGEEFNLLFKITKSAYINESVYSINKINKSNIKERKKTLHLLTRGESISQNDVSKILINSMSDTIFNSSIFLNPKTIEEKEEEIDVNMKKKNSVSVHMKKTKSISQMVQEPLMTFGNLIQRKISFNDSKDENFSNENSTSNENKKDRINSTDINYKDKDITTNENIIDNNEYLDLDSYFNESFKIYYLTPIILELSSDLFLENINMCIYMKWFNEINRYLKILISIPENIYINKYFEVKMKIKNISFNPMNLIIQIKDNENKDTNLDFKSNTKIVESVPSIISQTKIEHLGLIDCDDEKIYNLKFLPYIKGYCYLPNITLTDIYSDRQFYIVQSNKIFVKEN